MLTLETTIKKEEKVTKTIPMPYYCKHEGYFIKVISENDMIQVGKGMIRTALTWLNKAEIASATEITEYEFEQALNQALDTIKAAALNTEVV
jgi:predicted lipase